jgi:hypothetical protein
MRCLDCPPRIKNGRTERVASIKIFDSEKMSGRTHAREAAVTPAMNAGPMNGGVGPTSKGRTGPNSDSPLKSFLEPA